MLSLVLRWASLACLLCLAGCGFVHDEVLDGPYRLVAVDINEDMMLCRSFGAQGDCADEVGSTVFQAGANSQYIVAARHPRQWPEHSNRSISEFYYIVRQANEGDSARVLVRGPFSELEFQQEKRRLQLPEFSRVFDDLK
jgi:hypothetical protein